MAFSIQRAVSDGTMTLLPVSIEYFDREEISVLFDGVLNARQWEWVGSTDRTLSFTPAVDNGMEVMVVRTTDLSALRHQFSQGAQFTAESMDESLLQILHIAQEAKEGSNLGDIFHNLNFHGFKAINMGNGSDPGDAVNHAQMEVHDATIVGYMNTTEGYKNAAAASAAAAAAERIAAEVAAASAAAAAAERIAAEVATATAQAGIATTQAGIATAQANTATNAATTATTQAGVSAAQAVIATDAAGEATAQAATATAQAGTATTQAGIATTKADAAAASAGSVSAAVAAFYESIALREFGLNIF